jgi:hypothetical protein
MLGRNEEAIQVYKGLLRRGVARIAYGACGEGIIKARSLVNDSRYGLGKDFADMGNFKLATKYIKQYLAYRAIGHESIFNLGEVKKELVRVQQGKAI